MSKLTVTLPDDLHEQIRQELEAQGITTGQFIEMVVTKYFTKSKEGENNMATRTIAFQVSEELYQRIKEYIKWIRRRSVCWLTSRQNSRLEKELGMLGGPRSLI